MILIKVIILNIHPNNTCYSCGFKIEYFVKTFLIRNWLNLKWLLLQISPINYHEPPRQFYFTLFTAARQ